MMRVRADGKPDRRCDSNAKRKKLKDRTLTLPQPNATDYESQRRHGRLRALGWTIRYADSEGAKG